MVICLRKWPFIVCIVNTCISLEFHLTGNYMDPRKNTLAFVSYVWTTLTNCWLIWWCRRCLLGRWMMVTITTPIIWAGVVIDQRYFLIGALRAVIRKVHFERILVIQRPVHVIIEKLFLIQKNGKDEPRCMSTRSLWDAWWLPMMLSSEKGTKKLRLLDVPQYHQQLSRTVIHSSTDAWTTP